MEIRLEGLNELDANLGRAGQQVGELVEQVIAKTCADTERDAKAFCPVDTGNLRASIGYDVKGLRGEVGPTASYGRYVEEGTSRMAPHAYLGPAFDRNAANFVAAVGQITDRLA
ncbi:MAG TPA: HK97 gp10 family phage protein [Ornithinibacter sp.]|nr:HK97 gp10 family phage protein [Ornithinibacter sp.]